MKYFPITSSAFAHSLGVRAIGPTEPLIERTENYHREIELKRDLIAKAPHGYVCLPEATLSAQIDATEFLLPYLANLEIEELESLRRNIKSSSTPLLSLATNIQEDLVILENDYLKDYPVIAGVVCFPSGWSLPEKLGLGMLSVHRPVPDYELELAKPAHDLLSRLKVGRPVWRMNWGIRPTDLLDQSPANAKFIQQQAELVTSKNAGQRCFLRVERQTLSRLPVTNNVLFTIHTHQSPLETLTEVQKQLLATTLATCPCETLAYKGLANLAIPVIEYLTGS